MPPKPNLAQGPQQPRLFDNEVEHQTNNGQGSTFNDPAFSLNRALPVHRWVPWIAGFSQTFVQDVLARYLAAPGTVLDPFAGVGTTLVEAVLHGHNAKGFEINPYAALACRSKVNAYRTDVEVLQGEITRFQRFWAASNTPEYAPKSKPPEGFRTRAAFYSPRVLQQVLTLQDFVETVADPAVKDLFRLAFASTMVRYSNYSYEPSLARRVSSGKGEIHDFPVGETILAKLHEMLQDILWFKIQIPDRQVTAAVINRSFFDYNLAVMPSSIDLIITSPPYLNNYHYNRNTRPMLYWLGFVRTPSDMQPFEVSNFGKFWQTVREQERLDLAFELPDSDLADRLEYLRTLNPDKGVYGGNGWANYAASYFNDCRRFALAVSDVLKPGGTALVVIGNSILQGVLIPTDVYFGQIARSVGLELVTIDIPRATRVGSSIIQSEVRVAKAQDSHQLYEAIVELRKPY